MWNSDLTDRQIESAFKVQATCDRGVVRIQTHDLPMTVWNLRLHSCTAALLDDSAAMLNALWLQVSFLNKEQKLRELLKPTLISVSNASTVFNQPQSQHIAALETFSTRKSSEQELLESLGSFLSSARKKKTQTDIFFTFTYSAPTWHKMAFRKIINGKRVMMTPCCDQQVKRKIMIALTTVCPVCNLTRLFALIYQSP